MAQSHSVAKDDVLRHGKPERINPDQGSQFEYNIWIEYLEKEDIKIIRKKNLYLKSRALGMENYIVLLV